MIEDVVGGKPTSDRRLASLTWVVVSRPKPTHSDACMK